MYRREEFRSLLKKKLKPEHYEHSLRTADLAEKMAGAYGVDAQKAYIAGLLHDYTKSMTGREILTAAELNGIDIGKIEKQNPYLLHAILAARLVKKDIGVSDLDILSAIEKHTFADVEMSELDKIIYIADMVEPGRPYEALEKIRDMLYEGLNEVYRAAYFMTVEYLVKTKRLLHPKTIAVWNKLVAED
jgi:predicted HD superfamily hydrolase involved in NAD metabolism